MSSFSCGDLIIFFTGSRLRNELYRSEVTFDMVKGTLRIFHPWACHGTTDRKSPAHHPSCRSGRFVITAIGLTGSLGLARHGLQSILCPESVPAGRHGFLGRGAQVHLETQQGQARLTFYRSPWEYAAGLQGKDFVVLPRGWRTLSGASRLFRGSTCDSETGRPQVSPPRQGPS